MKSAEIGAWPTRPRMPSVPKYFLLMRMQPGCVGRWPGETDSPCGDGREGPAPGPRWRRGRRPRPSDSGGRLGRLGIDRQRLSGHQCHQGRDAVAQFAAVADLVDGAMLEQELGALEA